MSESREDFIYMAKLAEQAERYQDMVDAMKKIAVMDVELTVEERNLLSIGYKNIAGARRASWRVLNAIEEVWIAHTPVFVKEATTKNFNKSFC